MYARLILVAALVAAASAFPAWRDGSDGTGTNWAVLVAGSNGYYNYRHQSDIYHAYQILKKNGYPDSNIIVFHYDDIANNDANPNKGVVINKSGGPNNYIGVPKDYTGDLVTPENFLNVIKGNATAMKGVGSGKVLGSTSKDNVFINFSDHGATGLIAFPSSYLYAKDLIDALTYMHTNNMYNQLVFYLEACESGSMFENLLPESMNIYATTAANAEESSYACYYDDTLGTYLGDVYSVNWMENCDTTDITTETLQDQFNVVKNETTTSHVMEYGVMSWNTEAVSTFVAFPKAYIPAPQAKVAGSRHPRMDAVDSRDVVLETLKRRLAGARNLDEVRSLEAQIEAENRLRMEHDETFNNVMANMVGHSKVTDLLATRSVPRNFDCLREVLEHFEATCFKLTDYSLKYVYTLVNLCENGHPVNSIKTAIYNSC